MQGAKINERRQYSYHVSVARAAPKLRTLTLSVTASSCLRLHALPRAPGVACSVGSLSALSREHGPVKLRSVCWDGVSFGQLKSKAVATDTRWSFLCWSAPLVLFCLFYGYCANSDSLKEKKGDDF